MADEVCLINIGPKERAKRMRFGLVALAIGVLIMAALLAMGASPLARAPLALAFLAAGLGIFQAREKT